MIDVLPVIVRAYYTVDKLKTCKPTLLDYQQITLRKIVGISMGTLVYPYQNIPTTLDNIIIQGCWYMSARGI